MASTVSGHRKAGIIQALALLLPITMAVMGSVVLQPDQGLLRGHFANVPGNEYWVPFLLTVPAICATVFSVVSGYLADLFGRRPVLLVAMFIYVLVGIGPYFLQGLIPIAFCRVGVGLCEGVVLTVTTALLADYFKGDVRDRLMGTQAAIASTSASFLIPLSGYLAASIGWNGPFLVYLISAIWLVGIAIFTWEPRPDAQLGETVGSASWAGFPWARMAEICLITVLGAYFFYTVQFEVPNFLPKFGVTDPSVIGSDAGLISWGMAVGAVTYVALHARKLKLTLLAGLGSLALYFLFGLLGWSGVQSMAKIVAGGLLGSTVIFWLIDGHKLAMLLAAELTVIAVTYLLLSNAPNLEVLIWAGAFNQIGCGMVLPTLLNASLQYLPFEHRGRGTGIWQGTFASGQFIVAMSFPLIKNAVGGDYGKGIFAVGIVAAIAAVIAIGVSIRNHGRKAYEA